jgi:hypothetical protein
MIAPPTNDSEIEPMANGHSADYAPLTARPIGPGQRYVLGSSSAVVCAKMCRWVDATLAAAVYYSRCYVTGRGSNLIIPPSNKKGGGG